MELGIVNHVDNRKQLKHLNWQIDWLRPIATLIRFNKLPRTSNLKLTMELNDLQAERSRELEQVTRYTTIYSIAMKIYSFQVNKINH